MLERYGEKGNFLHCWWKCKLIQPLWRTVWMPLKKLKIELIWPCNPTSGHLSGDNHNLRRYTTRIFTAALFTIARTWEQPKHPPREEKMKTWYIYIMKYYSAIKKEWNNFICLNMDRPRECQTDWSQSDRERQISYDIA